MLRRNGTVALRTGALALFFCTAGIARASDGDARYAVVALIGNEMTITAYQPAVGSNIDRNFQNRIALPDDHFDRFAARVAVDAIHQAVPGAAVKAIRLADERSTASVTEAAADDDLQAVVSAARSGLVDSDTNYLLVLSKYRGEARLKTYSAAIGSGKLSGLGFYLDGNKGMKSMSTGERGRGFIAPYAYMMVTLFDLRTGAVIRSASAVETTTRANVGSDATLDPWTALTAEQKVRILDNLVGRALRRVVPQIVAPT